jgi:hypothetical protein
MNSAQCAAELPFHNYQGGVCGAACPALAAGHTRDTQSKWLIRRAGPWCRPSRLAHSRLSRSRPPLQARFSERRAKRDAFADLDPVATPADFGTCEQTGQEQPFSGWPPRSRRGAFAVNQPEIGEFTDAPTRGGASSWPL